MGGVIGKWISSKLCCEPVCKGKVYALALFKYFQILLQSCASYHRLFDVSHQPSRCLKGASLMPTSAITFIRGLKCSIEKDGSTVGAVQSLSICICEEIRGYSRKWLVYPFNMEWVACTEIFRLCYPSRVFHHRKRVKTSDQICDPLEDLLQPGHVGAAAGRGRGSEKQHNGDPLPSRQRDRGPGCWGTSAAALCSCEGLDEDFCTSSWGAEMSRILKVRIWCIWNCDNKRLSGCRETVVLTSCLSSHLVIPSNWCWSPALDFPRCVSVLREVGRGVNPVNPHCCPAAPRRPGPGWKP